MILGITGSIGSGKTTAAKIFSGYHYKIIDADEIGHKLLEDSAIRNKLIKNFGKKILGKNKNIDRKKLSETVFNSEGKLKKLDSIMHPLILEEIKKLINKSKNKNIIVDAPLLLETGADRLVDKVIVVKAFHENIIARNKRFTMEQLEKISLRQMGLDQKLKKADFMIDNTGDLEYLEQQVRKIIEKLNQKV